MPKNNRPIIILVRPQMGENIGAVARAMSNFGLSELRLVAPRDGWPNPKATEMAAGAENIISQAKLFPDFKAALADIQFAYATTARPRDMEKRVLAPQEAMAEIKRQEGKIALVFGPERSGLENEEVSWCDTLITIPTAPENWSLNIAQSMVIIGYEWWKKNIEFGVMSAENAESLAQHSALGTQNLATKDELAGLFGQLEEYLDSADYFRVAHKKPIMWQNLRTIFMRGAMSSQEVRTLRGMLRTLWERKRDTSV